MRVLGLPVINPRRVSRAIGVFAPLVVATFAVLVSPSAQAATPCCGYREVFTGDGDKLVNYDLEDTSRAYESADWPVSLLHWNNAEIDKVKFILDEFGDYDFPGATKYARLQDAPEQTELAWDEDGGKKTALQSCGGVSRHYRIYADQGDDRMYSRAFGYYVFGTAHADINEPCDSTFGYSELVENRLSDEYRALNLKVHEDFSSFGNPEPFRQEGNHMWLNDGGVTYVCIPPGRNALVGDTQIPLGCDNVSGG